MAQQQQKEVRWGILSTADIARKFVQSIQKLDNTTIVAVASRTLDRAQQWAKEQGIAKAYGSYEELLKDPEVDAVYIPTPTNLHLPLTVAAAQAKKHVLVEKPVGCNVAEVEQMIAVCKENGVQLMDNVMWTHHPRTEVMKQHIATKMGQVSRANTCFTIDKVLPENIRVIPELEPLGALGDLGWYTVRAMQMVFGETTLPEKVWANATLDERGAIVDFTGVLMYSGGRTGTFDCSFNKCQWRQWLEVNGTDGSLFVDGYILPYHASPLCFPKNENYDESTCFTVTSADRPWVRTQVEVGPCLAEVEVVRTFNQIVRSGELQQRWPQITLHNQIILNALLDAAKTEQVVHLRRTN